MSILSGLFGLVTTRFAFIDKGIIPKLVPAGLFAVAYYSNQKCKQLSSKIVRFAEDDYYNALEVQRVLNKNINLQ